MQQGMIFDIQRFSTADGPGIRTTAFFKGCNLHCPWCHNAEGLHFERQLLFDPTKCIGCGACASVCRKNAHGMGPNGHVIDREKCVSCMMCASVCFSGALEVAGKEYTADELAAVLQEDQAFYQKSGGGVTLSGGEVLCQGAFASAVLQKLQAMNIHTAIESNLSLPWEKIWPVLRHCDLVMADIKCMDSARHRQAVGLGNETILSNIQRAAEEKIPLLIRTPVIPGFNDDVQEIAAIARFLKNIPGLLYYELLSYHPLGSDKPAMLGSPVVPLPLKPPSRETMHALAAAAACEHISVRVDGNQYNVEERE